MMYVVVAFADGICRVIPDVAHDTRMHTISERIRVQRRLPTANYIHLGLCRPIGGALPLASAVAAANVQTEIIRLPETTTVAEALRMADRYVDVTGSTDVLSLIGQVEMLMVTPAG